MVFQTQPIAVNPRTLAIAGLFLVSLWLTFWHSGLWYINRVQHSPEEAVGAVVLLAVLVCLAWFNIRRRQVLYSVPLMPISLLLILYSGAVVYLPDLISTAIALTTLCIALYWLALGQWPPVAFWGLMFLSLPVVPSLQFYLGYPARIVSAWLTVPLLQSNGFMLQQQGTYLVWQGELLQFDAPCSGVTMLWAGLYLTAMLSFLYRFSAGKSVLAVFLCGGVVLLGNVVRAGSLFYLESGALAHLITSDSVIAVLIEDWLHEGVGMMAFFMIAALMVFVIHQLKHRVSSDC